MTTITINETFNAGVWLGGLHFNTFNFSLTCEPIGDSSYNHDVAYQRIKHLINDVCSQVVFVAEDEVEVILGLADLLIPVLTVPGPGPVDHIVGLTLLAKIDAICESNLNPIKMSISSSLGENVVYTHRNGDPEDFELMMTLTDPENCLPWWNDPAARFVTLETVEEVEEFEPYDSWADLGLSYDDDDYEVEITPSATQVLERDKSTPANSNVISFKFKK